MLQRPQLLEHITELDSCLYKKTTEFVFTFEDFRKKIQAEKDFNFSVNCHAFTRILTHYVPELKVIDGHYLGIKEINGSYIITRTEHSWLTTPDGAILETCAIGILSGMPSLIPTKGQMVHACASQYLTNYGLGERVRKKVLTKKLFKKINLAIQMLDVSTSN